MTMRLLTFRRIGSAPPPERELLAVEDDGSFTMWRSSGFVVGRFAGRLPDVEPLWALVAATAEVDPPSTTALPPGASGEKVIVGEVTASVEARRPVDGPWGALVDAARELLDRLIDQPLAAIAATLPSPELVRLAHAGSEPFAVEFENAALAVDLWRDGQLAGQVERRDLGAGHVDAGAGWSWDLPVGLDASGGGILRARVSFVARDEGVFVPLVASTPALTV